MKTKELIDLMQDDRSRTADDIRRALGVDKESVLKLIDSARSSLNTELVCGITVYTRKK